MTDARNFLINSDYPMDKVVYLKTGSVPIDGYPTTVAHGLSFTPLMGGYWSMTSDFSICYEFDSGDAPSSVPFQLFDHRVRISSTATDIQFDTQDVAGDAATCYYRVYAFKPSDATVDIDGTASSADNLTLDSDLNYMKLAMQGVMSADTSASFTVTHGLGYRPVVHVWYEFLGDTIPITKGGDDFEGGISVDVGTNSIVIYNPNGYTLTKIHYRIYADE